jgi:peptidoglycan/xylan/chitin deacetylase (PgdA/CDA1 family)
MDRRTFIKILAAQSILFALRGKGLCFVPEVEKTNIILTIDDGPRKTMEDILERLGEKNENPAIFYIIGENLKNNYTKELAKNALAKGHLLGNHSYSHPMFSKINFETAKKEIDETEKIIEELYAEESILREKKLFRFPYGDENAKVREYLKEKGYCIQRWDIDSNDWKYYSKEKKGDLNSIINNCKKAKNKDIVLMHDNPVTSNYLIPFFTNSGEYKLVLP